MNKIFVNQELQDEFDLKGYVIIPFLDSTAINLLSKKYTELQHLHKVIAPVHSTCDTNNKDLIVLTDKFIKSTCKTSTTKFFGNSNVYLSNFLVKEPGSDSGISPHADWSFVDERKFSSANIWCPLIDVNESNGCLKVLEGSHNFINTIRASPDTPNVYNNVMELVEENMKSLPVKAGEAIVYNHALLHSSPSNLSSQVRVALVLGIIPKDAELYFYYYEKIEDKRKINQYKVNSEWYYDYKKHFRPTNVEINKEFNFNFNMLSEKEFINYLTSFKNKSANNTEQPLKIKLIHKLKRLLNNAFV